MKTSKPCPACQENKAKDETKECCRSCTEPNQKTSTQGIQHTSYSFQKETSLSFKEAVDKVKKELAEEGFGVLTEIDVQQTLKKKINAAFPAYTILGACNPKLAYKALQAEIGVGLMLPCNVIVYETEGRNMVAVVAPTSAMSAIHNHTLAGIASQVEEKLRRVLQRV